MIDDSEELEDEIKRQWMKVGVLQDVFKNPVYKAYSDLNELDMYRRIQTERKKLEEMLKRW